MKLNLGNRGLLHDITTYLYFDHPYEVASDSFLITRHLKKIHRLVTLLQKSGILNCTVAKGHNFEELIIL